MSRLKLGVLISGRGTNMGALARAALDPDFPAEIVQVICNVPNAPGIDVAMEQDLSVGVFDHTDYETRADHERAMSDQLKDAGVELVCLAGYMRLLENTFLQDWRGKLVNIHPSLLPAFRGMDTHERALARGCRIHGCTVHYVTAELDGGPIIAQTAVHVHPEDDADSLRERVLAAEHALYPHAIRLIAERLVRYGGEDGVRDGNLTTAQVSFFHEETVISEQIGDT